MPQPYDRGLRAVSSKSDFMSYERSARDRAAELLVQDDSGITSTSQVHVRQIIPQWDLNPGSNSAWTGNTAIWTQQASGATNQGDEVQVYQLDNNNRMEDKTAVIFGLRDLDGGSVTDDVSQLLVNNTTGGTIEQYDLSQLDVAADDDYRALIENPIKLRQSKSLNISMRVQQDISTAAAAPALQLIGVVADDTGEDLEASDRFIASV